MIESSGHGKLVRQDYARLRPFRIRTVREGLRWHLVEARPGRYDFSSVLPTVRAAHEAGLQVIWDLCHFGWPDHLDVFSSSFVSHFARMARAFVELLLDETGEPAIVAPVNEISFLAWAGGEAAQFNPFQRGRADELKRQLVRATIEGAEAIWQGAPGSRTIQIDPSIHVVPDPARPDDRRHAEGFRQAQFQAWDMLTGDLNPELGGHRKYLDLMGINYYPHNQWVFNGPTLERSHPLYRPFRFILQENYARYGRPILLAETGAEADARVGWLRYVSREVRAAMQTGVPILGICWYPIVNHPGWEDGRHCLNGLWDSPGPGGGRPLYVPLARELRRQQLAFRRFATHRAHNGWARRA